MKTKQEFWRNRRCLVTGGVGFIGSHLCARLHEMGAIVVAVDRERAKKDTLFWHLNRAKGIDVIEKDISSASADDVVRNFKPKFIFHLAAEPYAPFTSQYPVQTHRANVVTTVNTLEAARKYGVQSFILASSACVFGAVKNSPLRLGDPQVEPEHYYTVTKREAEAQVGIFHRLYGVAGVICRFGNVYGPGDRHFGRIIPKVCRQVLQEHRSSLELKRSNGRSTFEFLFVDDAVSGMILSAQQTGTSLDTFQFSGGISSRKSVRQIAVLTSESIDGKSRPVVVNRTNPERTVAKYLDTSHAAKSLGWKPNYTLSDGLKITTDWYQRFIGQISPREI